MKNRQELVHKLSWFLLIFAIFQLFFSIANGIIEHDLFFNSDALYLPQIYQELFVNKVKFSTFRFSVSPFFFPDFLVFLIFRVLTGSFAWANVVTSILLFAFIILCLIKIFNQVVVNKENNKLETIFIVASSIYVLLIAQRILFLSSIFFLSPVWHEGSLLISSLLLLLFLKTYEKENTVSYVIAFIITSLTIFSDKFLIKDMILPLITSFLVLFLVEPKSIKNTYKYVLALFAGTFLGNVLYKSIIPKVRTFGNPVAWYKDNIQDLSQVVKQIFTESHLFINVASENRHFSNNLIIFFPIIFLCVLAAGIYVLRQVILSIKQKDKTHQNTKLVIVSTVVFVQFFSNVISTMLYGDFRSFTHLRYFSPVFIFPIFWGFLATLYFLKTTFEKHFTKVFVTLVIMFLCLSVRTIFISNKGGFKNFLEYKPPNLECLDKLISENNFKHGLSDFWNATPNNLYSKKGAQLHQIITYGGSYIQAQHTLSSAEAFFNQKYNYILTKRLHEEVLESELGKPDKIVHCPTTDVFVYYGDAASEIINQRFQAKLFYQKINNSGNSYTIKAADFEKYISRPYFLTENEIDYEFTQEGYLKPVSSSEAGYFQKGPIVNLERGTYKIDLVYKTNSQKTGIYVFINPDSGKALKNQFEDTNNIFKTYSTTFKTSGYLAFFPYYSGQGEILIKEMTITKLD